MCDAIAGRFVVLADGGKVTAIDTTALAGGDRGNGDDPDNGDDFYRTGPRVGFDVPGTARLPAAAGGDSLAVVSDTEYGRVPSAVAHNPYLVSYWFDDLDAEVDHTATGADPHTEAPQYLTVAGARSGRTLTSAVFTSPIINVSLLPTGHTLVFIQDERIHIVDPGKTVGPRLTLRIRGGTVHGTGSPDGPGLCIQP